MSDVEFTHLPGERWHLVREGGRTRLRPGAASQPDFAFRFSPESIEALARVEGGIGDFAVRLFSLIEEADPARGVGFGVRASFWRLARHGYVRLLIEAGPRVAAFGAARGVTSLGRLRRRVEAARREPGDRGPD